MNDLATVPTANEWTSLTCSFSAECLVGIVSCIIILEAEAEAVIFFADSVFK